MAEETQHNKLAAAKKKLKEYWKKNSPRVPAGANRNTKTNGSIPEIATCGGCQPPGDSPCQELAAVLDSRSAEITQLKNTIKSLKQQKKQQEHQLEEEKKANNKKQKAKRVLEVQIQTLNIEKEELHTDLYHMKHSLRYFEEKSKDLAVRLQRSLQRKGELESVLSDVMTTQKKKANQFSSPSKARTEWKLDQSMREQELLKVQLTQLKESFQQLQLERHEYAEHLKGERARWQQRMRKMSQEICTLKKQKQQDMRRVEELERSLSKLKKQMAEPLPPEPPAVPSEVELQHLREELERMAGELQAQVKNNQRISLLNRGQEERIREQEERLRKQEERLQEQHKSLQQLAKPQSVFEEPERLEAASQQKQQLTAQLSLMALPGEGHGGEHLDSDGEEAPQPVPSVPQDLENREAMSSFMDHLEEKADLSELVKKKELCFIHRWRERYHQKIHHVLSEPGGRAKDAALGGGHHQAGAQGGDEGEAAGDAADGIAAYSNYNNGHRKFLAAAQNPADEPGPGAPAPQELGAADKHGDLSEVSLTSSAQGEAREDPLLDKPTAQPIVQDHQEHPGLGSNCCVPFFCWAWLPRRRR
ncbi:putative golgin subfamily A member 8I isoform X2 [Gorilla gorilla gorilla]|uniref:putative golgin subfamily A member 8I isoform X2 n=1 Tax=Gorilla gorilla gorilla TaxID=9595 RepID=UPI002445EE2C|nr:putative golgin subfamily A member 8I isoform X2 [Gorilla gorilla gorilla]